jgi:ElaB/YqjD/DUF883 family membrane-anchored ribosome-binding protein
MNTTTNTPGSRDPISATASQARKTSNEMFQAAGSMVDSGRDYANDALDKADSKARDLRGSVDPVVDMLTAKAQKLARQSLDIAAEAKERAQQSLTRATDATSRYVSEQPVRAVLIAAAVGAAVALLVSTSRERNRNRY